MKHTPLPWKVEHDQEALASYIVSTNYPVSFKATIAQFSWTAAGIDLEEAKANCEFATHTVNVHDELLTTLKDARNWLDELCSLVEDSPQAAIDWVRANAVSTDSTIQATIERAERH